MTFSQILSKYRLLPFSERDKYPRSKRLMQAYLQTDPKYAPLFKKVWLWNEFPGRNDWSKEVGNPRYILDLLLSIINVSMNTLKIMDGLPQAKSE
jgi:predicted helicase